MTLLAALALYTALALPLAILAGRVIHRGAELADGDGERGEDVNISHPFRGNL